MKGENKYSTRNKKAICSTHLYIGLKSNKKLLILTGYSLKLDHLSLKKNVTTMHKYIIYTKLIINFFTFRFLSPPNSKCLQRFNGICLRYLHSEHSILNTIFLVVLA